MYNNERLYQNDRLHHCCVYSEKTPDDGQRNCLKHVEFHSKNKFEKLLHLVGFIKETSVSIADRPAVKQNFMATLFISAIHDV